MIFRLIDKVVDAITAAILWVVDTIMDIATWLYKKVKQIIIWVLAKLGIDICKCGK